MSDPPKVILLDSNAYFRLARSIPALLAGTFGAQPPYSLYVLKDVDTEYFRSARLKSKFEWVSSPEHVADRAAKRYAVAGKHAPRVDLALTFLVGFADSEGIEVSREDLKALAIGLVRGFPVVSDDGGMRRVAEANGIELWPVLKLLKLMVTEGRITLEVVQQIIQYLDHENDLPMSKTQLRKEYREYFGEDPPP